MARTIKTVFILIYKFPIDFLTIVSHLFDYRFVCCTNNYLIGLVPLLPIFYNRVDLLKYSTPLNTKISYSKPVFYCTYISFFLFIRFNTKSTHPVLVLFFLFFSPMFHSIPLENVCSGCRNGALDKNGLIFQNPFWGFH